MKPNGNSDLQNTENGKYVGKYKRYIFSPPNLSEEYSLIKAKIITMYYEI